MLSSYNVEQCRTVRHRADHQHRDAELPSICFDDLNNAEDVVFTVVDKSSRRTVTRHTW